MFSLESPHQGDSNEYTQHTIFNIKRRKKPKKNHLIILSLLLWDFSKGLKNKFETAVVEPSVFEPLKLYCIWMALMKVNTSFTLLWGHEKTFPKIIKDCFFIYTLNPVSHIVNTT